MPLGALLVATSCKFEDLPVIDDAATVDAAMVDASTDAMPRAAQLSTTQAPHDFGPTVIGVSPPPELRVTIRNSGDEPTGAIGLALSGTNPTQFQIVPTGDTTDCAGKTLTAGETCVAAVRFVPDADGLPTARLDISASPGGSVAVSLSGDAVIPAQLTTGQTGLQFGGQVVMGGGSATQPVVVRNSGEQPTGTLQVSLAGAHPGEFELVPLTTGDCSGASLGEQQTCTVQVRFRPTTAATRMATLVVAGAPGGSVMVPVTGDGLTAGDVRVTMGTSLDFGPLELRSGASSTPQLIRIQNMGGTPSGALAISVTDPTGSYTLLPNSCNNAQLGAGATCDFQVRFNPQIVGTVPATITIRDTVAMTGTSASATGKGSGRLTINKTGTGMITSAPTGISCGTGCTTQTIAFTSTPVQVTASELAGWAFDGWTDTLCDDANPSDICSVPLTQPITTIAARFIQIFTLTVTTTGSGTVTGTGILCGNGNGDCSQTYPINTMVQLDAEPDSGWEVYAWTGTGTSCAAAARTCTVSMSQARNVGVEFRRRYTLGVTLGGSGSGSIAATFPGGAISCSSGNTGTCSSPVFDGTTVTLSRSFGTAGTDSQILFDGWGGICASAATDPTCDVVIDGNKAASASFRLQHLVRVSFAGGGGGTVTGTGGLSCTASCTRYFDAGTAVLLTAAASGQSLFGGWGGACTGVGGCDLGALTAPRNVTATFGQGNLLTVNASGPGSVTSSPSGINCSAANGCTYLFPTGQMVQLTADPDAGAAVYAWTGAGASCGQASTCTVTMDAAKTVGVDFRNTYTLTLNVSGSGAGTVTGTLPGGGSVSCAPGNVGTCSATVFGGTTATLNRALGTAGSDSQNVFAWGGACAGSGTGASCSLAIDGNKTVSGVFTLQHLVRIAFAGAGTGSVSGPGPLSCTGGCSRYYDTGTAVLLTAAASGQSIFGGWSGACSGSGGCDLGTLTAPRSVTATFNQGYVLTVNAAGPGVVTSSPTGINCSATNGCTYLFPAGQMVQLTAAPAAGAAVYGWSGAGAACGQATTCTVTMDAAKTVGVELRNTYTLSLSVSGSGAGTISGSFTGGTSVSCAPGNVGTCTAIVFDGTTATLNRTIGTAGTDSQNLFNGWGGDCAASGADATCGFSINGNKAVSASFTAQHLVRVTLAGSGGGTVTGPSGLSCGASCTRYYDAGTAVTLSASANGTSTFSGWTGDCSGASCNLGALSAPRSVTATFTPTYTVGGQVAGLWTGANLVLRLTPSVGSAQTVTVSQEGTFTFGTRVASGSTFTVAVDTQAAQHTCTVQNPSGSVSTANVSNLSVTCTSTIVVSVTSLGPIAFTFDRQTSTQPTTAMSLLQSEIRVAIDGPVGSTGTVNGVSLAYQSASSPLVLAYGTNSVTVDFTVGTLSRRYTIPVDRGGASISQALYGKAAVRDPADGLGAAVAGSLDRIVVGAPYEDSNSAGNASNNSVSDAGAAYVFRRDGAAWVLEGYLKGSNVYQNRLFGVSVDISGDVLVVGGAALSGGTRSVWIFRRSGTVWVEEQRLDEPEAGGLFGRSVSIQGDVLAVGDWGESEAPTSLNGAVYIYRRTAGTWSLETTLRAPNRGSNDYFGMVVSLDQGLIAIGAPLEDSSAVGVSTTAAADDNASGSGAVYVYRYTGGTWAFEAYLKASNTGGNDSFGNALALANDQLVVGAPYEQSGNGLQTDDSMSAAGAAYVFRRSGTTWMQEAYLKDATPSSLGQFGNAVSIRRNVVAVGERTSFRDVHVFRFDNGTWARQPVLNASNEEAGDDFGAALDLFGEGLVVGAPTEDGSPGPNDNNAADSGACYVFR